jgi:arylformamidase
MAKLIDITVPLAPGLARYPDDPPFEIEAYARAGEGVAYTASSIRLSTHYGTHIDAPRHFFEDGVSVDAIALDILVGKVRVVDLTEVDRIERRDLEALDLREDLRVLAKTRMSGLLRKRDLVAEHVHLTADAARYLVQAGIKLIGIDYISVDGSALAEFPAHQELLGAGVVIVESLDLSEVEPGEYDLICLPLRLAGAEAAPARVVLRTR